MRKYIITQEQIDRIREAIEIAIGWHDNSDGYNDYHSQEIQELKDLSFSLEENEIEE